MPRTLRPFDRIAHYRVVGPLGAGGMGEVYRATDQSLERDVALKVLPPELVQSEERVRRFTLEAKSASSLNHPHIVTIYEIGEDRVRGDGATESSTGPLHYIAMELVQGKTLAAKIHEEKSELKSLLGWLAQAAEGVAKAHAAGIVHRDLKPGNVMVTGDGYAKVLDFGLAKLTERAAGDADLSAAPTVSGEQTSEGAVLGTVGYMAPEQVRGQGVDARADVFAFGCMLYEAATRRRPFAAETKVETLHRILHDVPAPVEELNAEAPAELRRLIRRCLAKDPNQRVDSMKTLALELREIVEEYDTLSASSASISGAGTGPVRGPRASVITLAMIIGASVLLTLVWLALGMRKQTRVQDATIRTVTHRGDVSGAVVSPDGRYLAYRAFSPGRMGLWVRQMAADAEVRILSFNDKPPFGLTFSPDGNSIFYFRSDPGEPGAVGLYQISTLGGSPVKRSSRIRPSSLYAHDRRLSFDPGGNQICFLRSRPDGKQVDVVVTDLEGGRERVLTTSVAPRFFIGAPAWSPDGKRIAVTEFSDSAGRRVVISGYRVSDGKRDWQGAHVWFYVNSLAWLPGGRAIAIGAREDTEATMAVWLVPYPSGEPRKLTNDPGTYADVCTSADGSSIAATRDASVANLWIADVAGAGQARQLTFASNAESGVSLKTVGLDGSILFMRGNDQTAIWRIDRDGSEPRPVLSGGSFGGNFATLPDGSVVFARPGSDRVHNLWRADSDGGNARSLTQAPRGARLAAVSRDGRLIVFRSRSNPMELWSMDANGGVPTQIAVSADIAWKISFSPDGTRIVYSSLIAGDSGPRRVHNIVPARGPGPAKSFDVLPGAYDVGWSPDGRALTYVASVHGVMNVFKQPLDGGNPEQVTRFTEGGIRDHEWSSDGTHLALARETRSVNVWLTSADGGSPIQITHFETGLVTDVNWLPHGRGVVFTYAQGGNDAVVIRDFR